MSKNLIKELREMMEDKHTFVALPIPPNMAKKWPSDRGGGDSTPPHFTLLFIGSYDLAKKQGLLDLIRKIANDTHPFSVVLEPGVDWFTSHDTKLDAREIAHKKPDWVSTDAMAQLYKRLRTEIEAYLGHEVKHFSGGAYKAHSTLRYEKTRDYDGPVPEGSWTANYIEVSSGAPTVAFKLGSTA